MVSLVITLGVFGAPAGCTSPIIAVMLSYVSGYQRSIELLEIPFFAKLEASSS